MTFKALIDLFKPEPGYENVHCDECGDRIDPEALKFRGVKHHVCPINSMSKKAMGFELIRARQTIKELTSTLAGLKETIDEVLA